MKTLSHYKTKIQSINLKGLNLIEQDILEDLNLLLKDNLSFSTLLDELKDEPEAYNYTIDHLEQFIAKFELN